MRSFVFNLFCLIQLLCLSLNFAEQKKTFEGSEYEMTFQIDRSSINCFFQSAKTGDVLEIEYQVIKSDYTDNELNINFQLYSPSGKELIADFKKPDGNHRYESKETGDYKFCFDNRYSLLTSKSIYFEMYVDSDSDDEDRWDDYDVFPELQYNDTMDQIKLSISKVKEDLNKVEHHQYQLKAIESRDRNVQEHNYTRVNNFSIITIIIILLTGGIQVICVKSLFDEKSFLHKFFKAHS